VASAEVTPPAGVIGTPPDGARSGLEPLLLLGVPQALTLAQMLEQAFGGSIPPEAASSIIGQIVPLGLDFADGNPQISARNRLAVQNIIRDAQIKYGRGLL
jgi:hypothetical protein